MSNKNNLAVGQILYEVESKRNCEDRIIEREISKIGKKYFYLKDDYRQRKFEIETMCHVEYNGGKTRLRFSKEEILTEKEISKLDSEVREHFYCRRPLTQKQVRDIHAILYPKSA